MHPRLVCTPRGNQAGRRQSETNSGRRRCTCRAAMRGLALALALSAAARADEGGGQQEEQALRLAPVVVVGAPILEQNELTRYAGVVSRIGRVQIEALNAQDLASALRMTPGVTISRYNPIGSFGGAQGGSIFIRGLGSSRPGAEIQTLIDGVPIYNAVWNHPLLDLNPVDLADSIEVYKGSQPVEFGNAYSTVNITPKRRLTEGFENRLSLAYGNNATWVQTFESGGRKGAFDYFLGQAYRSSLGDRPDADGRLTDYYLRLGYRPSDAWDLNWLILRTDNYADDPGPKGQPALKNGRYETREWLNIVTLAHHYERVEGTLRFYWNRGAGDWLDQASTADDTLNDWDLYGVRARETLHLWSGGELVGGADLDYTRGEATFTYDPGSSIPPARFDRTTLRLASPYVAFSQQIGDMDGLHAIPSVGVRYYAHSDFDSETAPHAGLVLGLGKTELHLACARGISYPGLNVIVFSENVIPALGSSWKELSAEKVRHYEAGIRRTFGKQVHADLTWFYDDGRNRYVFYRKSPGFGPPDAWENIEEFAVRGVEATLTVSPASNLSLFTGVTYLRTTPADLPYAPETTVTLGMNLRFLRNWQLSLDAQYVNKMYAEPQYRLNGGATRERVPSFFVVNGKISYDFRIPEMNSTGKLFVGVENITNTEYEYRPDYPMPGISALAGVELRF